MARIPKALRHAVIAAAQGRCAYCLSPERLMGVTFEIDHVIPSSAGGPTQLDNLCLSCPTCNRHKAQRLTAHDLLSSRSVRLFRPIEARKQEPAIHYKTGATTTRTPATTTKSTGWTTRR